MKNLKRNLLVVLTCTSLISSQAFGGEEKNKESPFSIGADVVSSYVWRGTRFSGASFQPYVELKQGSLTIGSWGSYDFNGNFAEADLYASYAFDFGLSLGFTDYYYPGADYFELGDTISSHAVEVNLGYEFSNMYISGNYIVNNSATGAGSIGNDLYFEAGYSFKNIDVFVGAGNGWHSAAGAQIKDDGTLEDPWKDDQFGICNLGISVSNEIKFTESFSLPVFGQFILNPEAKDFNLVIGLSF